MRPATISGDITGQVWDALVIGAGPAGAVSALELRRLGVAVLLVERERMPRWKVCGACLSPGALAQLGDLGLGSLPERLGAVPLTHLRLGGWGREARVPLRGSMSVSRSAFDRALVDAAVAEGVVLITGARARVGLLRHDGREVTLRDPSTESIVRARTVVVATGLAGLPGDGDRGLRPAVGSRIGVGAVLPADAGGYEPGVIHMAMGEAGYVGLVRVEDGGLNVAGALDPEWVGSCAGPEAAVQRLLGRAGFPALPSRPAASWKGTPALTRGPVTAMPPRIFAVGDAAGYVEPFTGEGMAWALGGARALAPWVVRAAAAWEPALGDGWTRECVAFLRRGQRLCRAAAWTSRRPGLTRAALFMLSRYPGAASPLVRRAAASPPSTWRTA